MITLIKRSVLFFSLLLLMISCHKEEITEESCAVQCSIKVYFQGVDFICNSTENSAVVTFDSDGTQLVLSNFVELVDISNLDSESAIFIEYENVDSTLFNSGALCGFFIIAPVAELTCISF